MIHPITYCGKALFYQKRKQTINQHFLINLLNRVSDYIYMHNCNVGIKEFDRSKAQHFC